MYGEWGAQSWVKRGNMGRRERQGAAYVPAATATTARDRPATPEDRRDRTAGGGAVGGGRAELPAWRRRGRTGAARRRPAERRRVGAAPLRGLAAGPGGRRRRGAGPAGGPGGRGRRPRPLGRRGGTGGRGAGE